MNASTANPVRLKLPLYGNNLSQALGLANAFKDQAKKSGGDGRVYREWDEVRVDLEGLPTLQIQEMIKVVTQSVICAEGPFKIAVSPRTSGLATSLIPGEYLCEKLTKKLLFNLPVGVWLVRHSYHWSVQLKTRTDRQRLWEQIVEKGAARKVVSVVWSQTDAETILARADDERVFSRVGEPLPKTFHKGESWFTSSGS